MVQAKEMLDKNILVTCDNWFYAPDGKSYRAVYGKLIGVFNDSEVLGIKTNSKSTNWYAQVGRVLIAGCQIHYAVNADDIEVNLISGQAWELDKDYKVPGNVTIGETPPSIYNAN